MGTRTQNGRYICIQSCVNQKQLTEALKERNKSAQRKVRDLTDSHVTYMNRKNFLKALKGRNNTAQGETLGYGFR